MGMIQNKTTGHARYDGYGISKATLTYGLTPVLLASELWALLTIMKCTLTGAMTIDAPVTDVQEDQELELWFTASGADRTVTFDDGFEDRGNLAVEQNTTGIICFRFNGTLWIEKSRSVTVAS